MVETESSQLKKKVRKFSIPNLFKSMGDSPLSIIRRNGPKAPQIGQMGFGGQVTLTDGSMVAPSASEQAPNPGDKVIVYTEGKHS
jgi:hypothetical protein